MKYEIACLLYKVFWHLPIDRGWVVEWYERYGTVPEDPGSIPMTQCFTASHANGCNMRYAQQTDQRLDPLRRGYMIGPEG